MAKIIAENWKMNPIKAEKARRLFMSSVKILKRTKGFKLIIFPPFVYLSDLKPERTLGVELGAQNCFYKEKGAFTGEVSPLMLKDLGVKYVIIGHSERRKIFAESDEVIGLKLKTVSRAGLKPILCLGETREEKEKGQTFKVLEGQIKKALDNVSRSEIKNIIIAYEPVWAIGAQKPCSLNEALTAVLFIRKVVAKKFGLKAAKNLKILYGGSINSQNSRPYLQEDEINGLLLGRASLDPKELKKIIRQ